MDTGTPILGGFYTAADATLDLAVDRMVTENDNSYKIPSYLKKVFLFTSMMAIEFFACLQINKRSSGLW